MSDRFEQALKLAQLGMSVIPVNRDKVPSIDWRAYMEMRADEPLITKWFDEGNRIVIPPNVGIVTGEVSGIVVIDVDWLTPVEQLKNMIDNYSTVIANTPRGRHYYFKYPDGAHIANRQTLAPGIDFLADNCYVVAPPSEDVYGAKYSWEASPFDTEIAELPANILEMVANKPVKPVMTESVAY